MNGLKELKSVFKPVIENSESNCSNNTSNTNKAGDMRYPDFERDSIQREGKVFILRRGVGEMSDFETVLHHWAIAIKFSDGPWITIEGVNEEGELVPGYSNSQSAPKGTIIDIAKSPSAYLATDLTLRYLLVITQFFKALSFECVRYIKASPYDLHKLAGSIPVKPYCVGTSDCQTWFLDALRKLQFFEIGTKSVGDCAWDALRSPTKMVTNTAIKAASTVTNTGLEAANTVGRMFSLEENPGTALVDGTGKMANHVINGVSDTASGLVDSVAGFAVNTIGLITAGGCATKNGLRSDIKSLQKEVQAGRMNAAEATFQTFGKAAGNVIYGAANTTTNVVGGVADTATGLISGVAGTVAAPFKAVEIVAGNIKSGDMHPALGVVATPFMIVGAAAEGVGQTVLNVGSGIGKTVVGIYDGLASIF